MSSLLSPSPPSTQYWLDRQWIHDHYSELVDHYANKWIAVYQGNVLESGTDLANVEDMAKKLCSASDIVFQFIDDGSLIL